VCNARYGNNGWLGLAQIWINGSHITQAITKLNDTYFNTATYNKPEWRNLVMCQEVGYTFGLDHQDENFDNPNLGSCMDYTSDPSGDIRGGLDRGHDAALQGRLQLVQPVPRESHWLPRQVHEGSKKRKALIFLDMQQILAGGGDFLNRRIQVTLAACRQHNVDPFFGTFARSMPQFGILLMLALLPLQMLSGSSTPRESMPDFVQFVMLGAPTTHFVIARPGYPLPGREGFRGLAAVYRVHSDRCRLLLFLPGALSQDHRNHSLSQSLSML